MKKNSPENKASKPPENKAGDNGPPQPDFGSAAQILLGDVKSAKSKSSKINSEKGHALKRVQDDCHVNKDAAQKALVISQMSDELQSDWLRSFIGMMPPLKIAIRRDLVDLAEGVEGVSIPVRDAPASELD